MAIICEELKLLYIMVGGTGCTSIGSILQERFNGKMLPALPMDNLDDKHNTLKQLVNHGLITKKSLKIYTKVANIRNPFDMVSTQFARLEGTSLERWLDKPDSWVYRNSDYADKLKEEIEFARSAGFEKWVIHNYGLKAISKSWIKKNILGKGHVAGQKQLCFTAGVNKFIRYESLEESFNNILKELGVKDYIAVPNKNPTKEKRTYRDYYTPLSKKIVERAHKQELSRFGYSFD